MAAESVHFRGPKTGFFLIDLFLSETQTAESDPNLFLSEQPVSL